MSVDAQLHDGVESYGEVLVAEDDPLYQCVIQRFLAGNGYHVNMVGGGVKALQAARKPGAPRLLMLDWMMPGLQGPEVCMQLRNDADERYRYVILLTAKDNKADIIAGLEAGADDYLTKPFDAHELLARARVGTRMLKLQDSLIIAQNNLRFQATHDPLTGIWNRGALFDMLRAETERAERRSTSITLLMIDLDHFKRVNDTFGHPVGDLVLQETAHRLAASVRSYDIVGRYGGEEFMIVAAELQSETPFEFGERMRNVVACSPVVTETTTVSISASIGVATALASKPVDIEKLIHEADAALYSAKKKGRNRVEIGSTISAECVA